MTKPIVWTIAGSDSSAGAGIQADLKTFHALNTHGCSVITALTAQNSYHVRHIEFASSTSLTAQYTALADDYPARALKLGMLGNKSSMTTLVPLLKNFSGPIICDPVMVATNGATLLEPQARHYFIQHILPLATLVTPNILEAENLLQRSINTLEDMPSAAHDLLRLGPQSVLIKGGHRDDKACHDYWTNGTDCFWLSGPRYSHAHTHGSGCTLSAAITAALSRGFSLPDALVLGKAFVSQAIRLACGYGQGPGPVVQHTWPVQTADFPCLTYAKLPQPSTSPFPACTPIGFYPIVDNSQWVEKLVSWGVQTIQLRIKDKPAHIIQGEIQRSCEFAQRANAHLFINDDWQSAIQYGAYGVHLGQEDLCDADLTAIATSGLRLGVSTHNLIEVARAHALQPSYVACGPIYPTQSKAMAHPAVGCDALTVWQTLLPYPIVAIGGINEQTLPSVLAHQPAGVALIGALQQASDPKKFVQQWLKICGMVNLT